MPTLICDCNQTMPLQPQALGAALNETLTLHSGLCRREAGAFQKAVQSGDDVVVAEPRAGYLVRAPERAFRAPSAWMRANVLTRAGGLLKM